MSQLFLDRASTWALLALFAWSLGYALLRLAGLDDRPPSRRQQRRNDVTEARRRAAEFTMHCADSVDTDWTVYSLEETDWDRELARLTDGTPQ